MSILRVLVDSAPCRRRSEDAVGALRRAAAAACRSGTGPPSSWPDAAHREAVLAAPAPCASSSSRCRRCPPIASRRPPRSRSKTSSPDPRRRSISCASRATATDASTWRSSRARCSRRSRRCFERVVAEPARRAGAARGTWRWYASGARGGFVRRPDGSAFAVSAPSARGPLPPELALPLGARRPARAASLSRVEVALAGRRRATARRGRRRCRGRVRARRRVALGPGRRGARRGDRPSARRFLARAARSARAAAARRFRWAVGLAVAALAPARRRHLRRWALAAISATGRRARRSSPPRATPAPADASRCRRSGRRADHALRGCAPSRGTARAPPMRCRCSRAPRRARGAARRHAQARNVCRRHLDVRSRQARPCRRRRTSTAVSPARVSRTLTATTPRGRHAHARTRAP